MALNKDTLGSALYNMAEAFNDQEVPATPEDLQTRRQNFWKGVAEEIINHIKTSGVVNTTGTAAAQTGTMT